MKMFAVIAIAALMLLASSLAQAQLAAGCVQAPDLSITCTYALATPLPPGQDRTVTITIVDNRGNASVEKIALHQSSISNVTFDGKVTAFTLTVPGGVKSVTITE